MIRLQTRNVRRGPGDRNGSNFGHNVNTQFSLVNKQSKGWRVRRHEGNMDTRTVRGSEHRQQEKILHRRLSADDGKETCKNVFNTHLYCHGFGAGIARSL
jgi:hypothetical protein